MINSFYFHFPFSCNFCCPWCVTSSVSDVIKFDARKSVSYIKKVLSLGYKEIRFSGGEPLLYNKEFQYILDNILQPDITYTVNTNGSLLYKNFEMFNKRKPRIIWISVNTLNEVLYNRLTKTKLTIKHLIRTIQKMLIFNINIGINILMTNLNINEIPDIISTLLSKNIREYKLLDLTHLGRGYGISTLNIKSVDMDILFKKIQEKFAGFPIRIRADVARLKKYNTPVCILPTRSFLTLSSDGKLYQCYQMAFNKSQKYILQDMYKNNKINQVKLKLVKGKIKPYERPPCLFLNDSTKRCPIYLERIV